MHAIKRNRSGKSLSLALTLAAAGALSAHTAMAAPKKVPLPKPRPSIQAAKQQSAPVARNVPPPANRAPPDNGQSAFAQANVGLRGSLFASRATFKRMARPVSGPFAIAPSAATSAADIALVKQVIEATRKGNEVVSDVALKSIADPVARKLAEWVILKSDNTKPTFQRYANFINANPSWPHSPLFRRRAENALWNDRLDDGTVRAFFANRPPTTSKGRYVLARALVALGDSNAAAERSEEHT